MQNLAVRAPILLVLALGVLVGCTAAPTTPTPLPPSPTPALTTASPLPATPQATATVGALPTATALIAPTDQASGLLGPEWHVAASGDINADGINELIAYQPSDVTPSAIFANPVYADYTLIATEIVIVQPRPDGTPLVLVAITAEEVKATDKVLARFVSDSMPERRPGAFLLAVNKFENIPVGVIPIEANGEAYGQGVGVYWNTEQQAYRLYAMGRFMP